MCWSAKGDQCNIIFHEAVAPYLGFQKMSVNRFGFGKLEHFDWWKSFKLQL